MVVTAAPPPMVNPAQSLPGQLPGTWWVAHTKSRFEKAFAWDLFRLNISYFLPMVERVAVYRGRKRRAMRPLFPSYVFLCGSEKDRYRAMTTGRLCQTLEVARQEDFVAELDSLALALTRKAALDPYPFVAVGQRYRVSAGPFEGLEGIVVGRRNQCRLVLEVGILGQGACLEIEADFLEKC